MKQLLRFGLILWLMMLGLMSNADAQFQSYLALDSGALAFARSVAQDSLNASDMVLSQIASLGNFIEGLNTGMSTADGTCGFWGYSYVSPSKRLVVNIIVNKIQGNYSTIGGSVDPILDGDPVPAALDSAAPFTNSDKLIERLSLDTVFARFRKDFPDRVPDDAYLNIIAAADLPLPEEFPQNEQIWAMDFTGDGDSSMACFESIRTGFVFCSRADAVLSVALRREGLQGSIAAYPNPTSGRTRIRLAPPPGFSASQDVTLGLYNVAGQIVLDLTESFLQSGRTSAQFDAGVLPPGMYFCKASASGWSAMIPIIISQ